MTAIDPSGMADAIAGMADQLRQGERVGAAAGVDIALPGAVVVAAMGGSAMGGELLRALVAGECPVPITRVRGFRIPHWAGPGTLVMCVSYSGETDETLACARQAHRQGAGLLVVGAGGTLVSLAQEWGVAYAQVPAGVATGQPRAALGYLFGAMAGAFGACGLASEGIASAAAEGVEDVDVAAARDLGERLAETIPLIYGAGPDRRRRLPLEDAAERERKDARVQPCPARARTQRDRRLGGGAGGAVCGRAPLRWRPGRGRAQEH